MYLIKALICCLLLSLSSPTYASKEIGNGGDVITCDDGSIQVLDLYEGRIIREFEYLSPYTSEDYTTYIKRILTRYKKTDATRANRYLNWLETFEAETKILAGIVIPDIPDHGETVLPANCQIEQIAFQKGNPLLDEARYYFKKELWERLDTQNKAFIVLHELIYREAIMEAHLNSISVRYFNSLLFSTRLDELSGIEYAQLMQKIPFSTVSISDIDFQIYKLKGVSPYITREPLELTMNNILMDSLFLKGFLHPKKNLFKIGDLNFQLANWERSNDKPSNYNPQTLRPFATLQGTYDTDKDKLRSFYFTIINSNEVLFTSFEKDQEKFNISFHNKFTNDGDPAASNSVVHHRAPFINGDHVIIRSPKGHLEITSKKHRTAINFLNLYINLETKKMITTTGSNNCFIVNQEVHFNKLTSLDKYLGPTGQLPCPGVANPEGFIPINYLPSNFNHYFFNSDFVFKNYTKRNQVSFNAPEFDKDGRLSYVVTSSLNPGYIHDDYHHIQVHFPKGSINHMYFFYEGINYIKQISHNSGPKPTFLINIPKSKSKFSGTLSYWFHSSINEPIKTTLKDTTFSLNDFYKFELNTPTYLNLEFGIIDTDIEDGVTTAPQRGVLRRLSFQEKTKVLFKESYIYPKEVYFNYEGEIPYPEKLVLFKSKKMRFANGARARVKAGQVMTLDKKGFVIAVE